MASPDNLPSVSWIHFPVFQFYLELFRKQSCTLLPLPTSSPSSNCFLLSRIAEENKHFGFLWQQNLESFSLHFSRWETWRGDKKKNFFFPINFHLFQVWVNSGHTATRMIWLWKLLISHQRRANSWLRSSWHVPPKGLCSTILQVSLGARSAQGAIWAISKR